MGIFEQRCPKKTGKNVSQNPAKQKSTNDTPQRNELSDVSYDRNFDAVFLYFFKCLLRNILVGNDMVYAVYVANFAEATSPKF